MSYNSPHSNPNYYPGPPPSHSPQPGYGPPSGQFQHQQPGLPPQQGHGAPQFQQQGPFPPQQGGYPPQQQQFPLQQGGYPPQQQQFPPQQAGFGPPTGQFQQGYGPPAMPSPGYDPRAAATGDARKDADALRGAMKGFGTNEATLINILSKPDPLQMALLRNTYTTHIRRNLEKDITSETSSYFKEGLLAIVRGPLMQDVHDVHKAIKGMGTKEVLLNDVLLGRSNADMRAIKQAYQEEYHHTMEADVKGDLSMKTERLFGMVMAATRAEESAPIIPQELDRDITEIHRATDGRVGTDQMEVCSIICSRSDGQLRAIAQQFHQKYHIQLEKIIEKEFSGHMQSALLLMVGRATDRAMADAVQLEEAMAGMGTKDALLVERVVKVHWNKMHMDQVKRAYAHRYKKDLISRVRGEVRGDYEKLMIACLS